jgi:hypothetical protein
MSADEAIRSAGLDAFRDGIYGNPDFIVPDPSILDD